MKGLVAEVLISCTLGTHSRVARLAVDVLFLAMGDAKLFEVVKSGVFLLFNLFNDFDEFVIGFGAFINTSASNKIWAFKGTFDIFRTFAVLDEVANAYFADGVSTLDCARLSHNTVILIQTNLAFRR